MQCRARVALTDRCEKVAFIAEVCHLTGNDVMVQARCIFAPHLPFDMQWSNMRQTGNVSQNLNETTSFATVFSTGHDFP